jgi:hypothetical protein
MIFLLKMVQLVIDCFLLTIPDHRRSRDLVSARPIFERPAM